MPTPTTSPSSPPPSSPSSSSSPLPSGAEPADGTPVRIGALVPLTPPGWVGAGRHLLAGLEAAVRDVNAEGGIGGRPLELLVRDTAADPERATAAVEERAAACTAAWQYLGPSVDGVKGAFEKAVTALAGEDWVQGERQVEKLDEKGGSTVQITLRKRGWVLYARHVGSGGSMDMEMVSLQATETACWNRFTEEEQKTLFGEDAEQG